MKKHIKYIMPALLLIINAALIIGNISYSSKLKDIKNNIDVSQSELDTAREILQSEKNKLENLDLYGKEETTNENTPSNENETPEPAPTKEQPVVTKSVSVCLDAGHGKTSRKETEPVSPGSSTKKAANVSGAAGEEEFNLSVALLVRDKLTSAGVTVDMTRTTHESDKSNIERAEQGNNSDYCIRIHADGSTSSSAHGISVLVPEKSYYSDKTFVSESRELAQYILDETVANTGAKNNGLVTRSDLTGFNWSKVPVILIECGFLSNPQEKAKLQTPEYQEKIADGIANGFLNYIRSNQ